MAVSRSPHRDPRRRPSVVASSSKGGVRRILSPVSNLYMSGGASRSCSTTRALTVESTESPTTAPATEREEEDDVNNDTNNTLDDSDVPADATDESLHRENAIEDPTEYDNPETRNGAAEDTAAKVEDAPHTSSVAVGTGNARHVSPSQTHEAPFELRLPWFTATSGGGSTTCTKESVTRTDDEQDIVEATDDEHTDAQASHPATLGATIPIGSSTHATAAVSENGDQPQSASSKGKKKAVNELDDDRESDDEREGLETKRARMCGDEEKDETEERRREEKREGKKRARSDDDESPAKSGETEINMDEQHQAKRAKHWMDGSSICHSSASPRQPDATFAIDANETLPTPVQSQENEPEEHAPAATQAALTAPVIATLTINGLVTPDALIASSDDDSDSTYSSSGSSSSSFSDSDDTDSSSSDESDDTSAAPAAPPAPIPAPPQMLLQLPFRRRMRAFYGAEMAEEVFRNPYI